MTISVEQQQAVVRGRKFLEKLCDPGRTPRVPSVVRNEARELLKNYPSELGLITSVIAVQEKTVPQYNGVLTK